MGISNNIDKTWKDNIVGKSFTLDMVELGFILGTQFGPLRLPGVIPEHRCRSKPEHH